jgi:hypothetical protein
MVSSYKTLRKKEYEKKSFQNLQAEAFCDLLEVVLPDSKLPSKVKEFKGVIQTIKQTYPGPRVVEITRKAKAFKIMFNLIRKVF